MASPTAIINLRPLHTLLNPKFDGYKLSLDPVPVLKTPLPSPLRRVYTNDDQYTFLHAKLFSLHNHLFRDPWLSYSSYFVDDTWTIQNVRYDTTTGSLGTIKSVLKLSKPSVGHNDYNPSCCFVSEKYCVFSDGCGTVKIIDTGDRFRNDEWKTIHSAPVFENSVPFVIQDARLESVDGERHINCLLLSVQEKAAGIDGDDDKRYEAVIDWVRFAKEAELNVWTKLHVRRLCGKSLPEYCVLDVKSNGILLSTDQSFEFVFDAEHPLKSEDPPANGNHDPVDGEINFTWTQTDEDVMVHFKVSRDSNKKDFKIVCSKSKLQVYHRNVSLLDAELCSEIDNDLTTWNLENEILQVTLVKSEAHAEWNSLLKNAIITASEEPTQAIRELPAPSSATLRNEMEECDFGDNECDREYTLVRLDAISHETTHKAIIGQNNPILFAIPLRAGHPPAFALRSDVDVCLWLPLSRSPGPDQPYDLQLRHEGTLNAFGYIQASKQQKKYIQCAPDFSYSIVCESQRHIFIYKDAYESASGLKNRSSSEKIAIGQQKLITMDESDEIVGVICENDITMLLTPRQILCLQIKS